MKVKELLLQNFRCFNELSVTFDDRLTVFVAENGMGKTTILDGIAVAFGRLLTRLPNVSGITSKQSDIRVISCEKLAPFLRYWIRVEDFDGSSISWSARRKRDGSAKTLKKIKEIDNPKLLLGTRVLDRFADTLIDRENENEYYLMPVIAYYGTSRAVFNVPMRKRNFRKTFDRFNALSGALASDARFRSVFEWFAAKEDEERRAQVEKRDFEYRHPELQAVRKAIEKMLPGISNPRTKTSPLRLVVDWKVNENMQVFRIEQLSDGYKTALAMVMDIARRMAQANPPYEDSKNNNSDPLDTPAIILIDEIDLHLHPKWQQHILPDLLRTFQKTQFIVTTHSPQLLTTVPTECIRIIEDGQIHSAPSGTEGAEASRILKRVLGVDVRPPENSATKEINEYLALVDADQWDSPRALELRSILDARYQGEEPALLDADLLIENRKWELGR